MTMTLGMKFDEDKIDYSLIDDDAEEEFAAVLTFGAVKYERDSWRFTKEAKQRYWAALRRHFRRFRAGERLDPETGNLHHLACAACCVHFLLAIDLAEAGIETLRKRFPRALQYARDLRARRLALAEKKAPPRKGRGP